MRLPRILGLSATTLGAAALLGWILNLPLLESVFPGLVTMKANTACGMILGGLALALLSLKHGNTVIRLCTDSLSVAVALLGSLTLAECFSGLSFGMDELLFRDLSPSAGTSKPGQMSPSTAFCFVVLGGSLWIASRQRSGTVRHPVLAPMSVPLVFIGGIACFGQILNGFFRFQLWNYLGMAVHTALGFLLLGVGLLALSKGQQPLTWVLGRNITCGFVAAIAIMVTAAGISWNDLNQLKNAAAWVSHTHQVLEMIEQTRAGVIARESSQRGHLIPGSVQSPSADEQAKTKIRNSVAALRRLTSDNAHQQSRLDQLQPLIEKRETLDEKLIAMERQQGIHAAQQMFVSSTDIPVAADLARLLDAMRDEENTLLVIRERRSDADADSTFLVLPMAVFISLTILSLALFFVNAGISERSAAEELSAQLAAIVDSSNDAIIGKDLNSIITSWNAGAEKMFGYTHAEMIGQPILRLIPSDRHQEEVHIIARVKSGERIEHFETLRVTKDGRLIDVAATVSPIKDKSGLVVGASKVARDITERKRAEDALREGERQFHTMVNAIPQLAWVASADGSIFWYNQRWFDYTGTTLEQMNGWGWERVHDPALLPTVMERWKASLASGEPFEMEFPLRAADGHFGWFLTRVFPMRDNSGTIVRWFGTNTDLSQKRAADEEIKELNANLEQRVLERTAQLEAANHELEAFSYSVSHDLRAPLRAVDGYSQAVLEDYGASLPEQGRKDLLTIREGAQLMGVLIDDLLRFSRLSRTPLNKRQVNTGSLVGTALESLTYQREGRQIDIRVGELPACRGDSSLLNQVWINLISNALKYTRRCETAVIEIGCRLEDHETIYYVRDNGAGFNMRYVNKLFGVFQRLHRADEFEGTGVGLAIVQRIILRHGGRIWADAALNQGATFSFTLEGKVT